MYTTDRHIDSVLFQSLLALYPDKVTLDIIIDRSIFKFGQVNAFQQFEFTDFFFVSLPDIRSKIKIESRNSLTSMHLILDGFHGNTCEHSCRLDSLGRTGLTMTGMESLIKNLVERMLQTSQTLRRVIILVMNMYISIVNSLADIIRKQALIHISLRRLRCELHHHTCRRICIHVRILTRNIIGLSIDNLLENFAGLGLSGEIPLVAVSDILFGDLLARALHELELDAILDFLHSHLILLYLGNRICDLGSEDYIFPSISHIHSFQDSCHNFLIVKIHETSVAFNYMLDHSIVLVLLYTKFII